MGPSSLSKLQFSRAEMKKKRFSCSYDTYGTEHLVCEIHHGDGLLKTHNLIMSLGNIAPSSDHVRILKQHCRVVPPAVSSGHRLCCG